MKKNLPGLILVLAAATAVVWLNRRELTLADLQRQYAFAKTPEQKEQVVERLEKYYLNLHVPDTLRRHLDREAARILDTTKIQAVEIVPDTNVYRLESQLQSCLDKAMIARVRTDLQASQILMNQAHVLAKTVDAGKQVSYWAPFVEQLDNFTPVQAASWMKTHKAERLCRNNQDYKFVDAECYAALGLSILQQTPDERIRLNILQCLQYILYEHRSMYDLSLALGQKILKQTEKIKHPHRATSIIYHEAQAYSIQGENQKALSLYETVLDYVDKFRQIIGIDWYIIPALLGKGERMLELGEFDSALSTCIEIEAKTRGDDTKNRIRLQILKWNIHLSTGNYEESEEELKQALTLAEASKDTYYLICCLNNFGVMFNRMYQYDWALDYYDKAKSLFRISDAGINLRMLILNNIASIVAFKNDSLKFNDITQEAKELLKLTNVPSREAELLRNIGYIYEEFKRYNEAIKYYQEADSIYSTNSFIRFDLETKIDITDCLIKLSKFNEAKAMLAEIKSFAKEIDDIEIIIDAIARLARVQHLEGNIAKAVESSNQLLFAVDIMSSRFSNSDRLMAYRQKIYDFLKDAVLYELAFRRADSAFVKLDYAKAYALKNELTNKQKSNNGHSVSHQYVSLDSVRARLKKGSILVDYMVLNDTLYAFVVDNTGLYVSSNSIDKKVLEKTVATYTDSIYRTMQTLQHYNAQKAHTNYAGIVAIGQKLYEDLLGWPDLQSRLRNMSSLYIVLDEPFYEIPFSTLIAKGMDTTTFFIDRVSISILPSASFLESENAVLDSNNLKTKKILISADRGFKGAEQFVGTVKKLFPFAEELIISDDQFTKDAVLKKLQEDYSAYIFIGHGAANPKYPDRSYIEVSVKASDKPLTKTIRLTLDDLKKISGLSAEMVMLVGCETASGRIYHGTGISGLYQGFVALGAKNVLGNLWKIDDSQAITQAQSFLIAWLTTADPAQALRECQRHAIQALESNSYYQHPHPFLWGSSILFTGKYQ